MCGAVYFMFRGVPVTGEIELIETFELPTLRQLQTSLCVPTPRFSASTSFSTSSQLLARGAGRCSFVEFVKTIVFAPSARSRSMFAGESSMYRSAPTAVFCCMKHRSQYGISCRSSHWIVWLTAIWWKYLMNSRCVMMRIRTPSFDSRRSACGAPAIGGSFKKQLALHDRELVQRVVTARRLIDAPLDQPPRHPLRQRIESHAQPLGRNRPQPAVEIGHHAVEIDTENKGTFGHDVMKDTGCRMQRAEKNARMQSIPVLLHPASSILHSTIRPRNFCSTSSGAGAYVLGSIEQLARPWLRLRIALE